MKLRGIHRANKPLCGLFSRHYCRRYNTKEGKSCVIYIRVSSERQVKGYRLDGQKHYLADCAGRGR